MEPISSSGASQAFRPIGAGPGSELGAVLRAGRVLGVEVLSPSADGTVLLAIGRYSVPAKTELRMQPGTRFLARVEEAAGGLVLNILDEAAPDEDFALLRALRAVVGEDQPIGERLGALARALSAEGNRTQLPLELQSLLRAIGGRVAQPDGAAGALRELVGSNGLTHEAALAALLGLRPEREAIAKLRGDLKALLLRGARELASWSGASPELREALGRALAAVEGEQLLNLARERNGEPIVLSFPFPDAEGWATARLLVPPRRERKKGADVQADLRIVLGIELSRLGPLRAELVLAPGVLSVSVLVTRPGVARRIEADLARLAERLGDGRRSVRVQVRLGSAAEAALGLDPRGSRYLSEHHVMNVSA